MPTKVGSNMIRRFFCDVKCGCHFGSIVGVVWLCKITFVILHASWSRVSFFFLFFYTIMQYLDFFSVM